jgi:hypothetical protein
MLSTVQLIVIGTICLISTNGVVIISTSADIHEIMQYITLLLPTLLTVLLAVLLFALVSYRMSNLGVDNQKFIRIAHLAKRAFTYAILIALTPIAILVVIGILLVIFRSI